MNPDAVSFDARPRRSRLPMIAAIGLLAFIVGALVTYWYLTPLLDRLGYRAPAAAIQPIMVHPQAVQRSAAPAPGTDFAALYAREIALAGKVQQLEERVGAIDTDSRNAANYATRAEGLLVAFAARRALDRGLPLGYVEGELRRRFDRSQPRAVRYVTDAAAQPVTIEDLRVALDGIGPDLVWGDTRGDWLAGVRREIAGLVTLREDGSPSARPNDRLIRARRMLDAGQVEGALAEVTAMPGADQASGWIDAARRYIYARRALNQIEAAAIGQAVPVPVAATPPPPAPAPAAALSQQGR